MPTEYQMRPWLLTFKDADVESAYQRYVLRRHFRSDDLRFFFVTTVVMFGLSCKTIQEQDMEFSSGIPYFMCGVLTVAFWYIYKTSPVNRQVYIRPYMSVTMRLCIAASGSWTAYYGHEYWLYGLARYKVFSIVQFFMATETFGNLPYAFGITTDFKLHVPVQVLTYLIFLTVKAPTVCKKVCISEGASLLYKLEGWVNTFFEFWSSLIQSSLGPFTMGSVPKVSCLHSTVFLMTYFSMGFVSYSLWKWEKRTRIEFTATRSSHSLLISKTETTMHVSEAMAVISIAAVFWTFSTPLTRMLASNDKSGPCRELKEMLAYLN